MSRNIVGAPVRGEDFFDREELVALVWDRLGTGNVLLAAPRRFGKTSLMYRLKDEPQAGWHVVHVDAESIREPANFVIAVLDAMMADRRVRKFLVSAWRQSSKWARDLFPEMEMGTPWDVNLKIRLKEKIGPDWSERGEALLRVLRKWEGRLLLIIDELPVMLHLFEDNDIGDAETRAFLYWFRRLRVDPDVGLTNCRFLIGGSIGIEHYLSRLGAVDSFNDFERVTVGELTQPLARDFLETRLASRGVALSRSAVSKMLELVGTPIPFFLQVFVAEVAAEVANGAQRMGPKKLEEIYHHRVLGAVSKTYFQHYYDRLRWYDKPDERAAKALLRQLALAFPSAIQTSQLRNLYGKEIGEGASDDGFGRLVGDLENDFYVRYRPEDAGYAFASKILCDWWRRYYAF